MRYIAFDVETPNHLNNRMSAIGITIIEDGEIIDSFYSLVNPEVSFDYFNTQLTGIDAIGMENPVVEVNGDTAMVTYTSALTANAYGAQGTFRMKGTHYYHRIDGEWIAVNRPE